MLDHVHNQCPMFYLSAFRTSPIESVYFDSHAPCSMLSRSSHCLNIPNMVWCLFQVRMLSVHFSFALSNFENTIIKSPNIMLDLVHLKKDHTDASVYQQLFMEILDRYRGHIPVYTDGSWDGNSVAFSNTVISTRLPE